MSFPDMDLALPGYDDSPLLPPGATSLALLQAVYRSDDQPLHTRMKAAIAALPFEHPRLAVTAVVDDRDLGARLARAIERSARVIEFRPIEHEPPRPVAPTAQEVSANALRRPMVVVRRR
jgi:hypothetical protein